MKKIFLLLSLLLPLAVSAQWVNTGNALQRTADGFKYRTNLGSPVGYAYWYTLSQTDSAVLSKINLNAILNQNIVPQPANGWIGGTFQANAIIGLGGTFQALSINGTGNFGFGQSAALSETKDISPTANGQTLVANIFNTTFSQGVAAATVNIVGGGGSLYVPGVYTGVSLKNTTTITGISATANITVGAVGNVTNVTITNGGARNPSGNTLVLFNPLALGGTGSGFSCTVNTTTNYTGAITHQGEIFNSDFVYMGNYHALWSQYSLVDKKYVDSLASFIGGGSVTNVSGVNANGFTWSIANPSTTPALTLSLQNATTSQSGQITSTDWNTFNTKLSTATAASTYQTLANLETTLTNSTTLYPSGSAMVNTLSGYASLKGNNHFTGKDTLNNAYIDTLYGQLADVGSLTIESSSWHWENPNIITSVGAHTNILMHNPVAGDDIAALDVDLLGNYYKGTFLSLGGSTQNITQTNPYFQNGIKASQLQIVSTISTNPRGFLNDQYSNDAIGAKDFDRKARGTLASPLAIVAGDVLGGKEIDGHDGTNFVPAAKIIVTSTGTIATGIVPATMALQTANPLGTLVNGVVIDQNQNATVTGQTRSNTFLAKEIPYGNIAYSITDPTDSTTFQIASTKPYQANTIIGYNADPAQSTGASNTIVGVSAAQSNTGGREIVAIGFQAMQSFVSNPIGTNIENALTVAIGSMALKNYVNGNDNVSVGQKSLINATYVQSSIAMGAHSGAGVDSINNAILIGRGILDVPTANATATSTVIIGSGAAAQQSTGGAWTDDAIIGFDGWDLNASATRVTGIGSAVGYSATGHDVVFAGYEAGENSTCSNCIAIGSDNTTIGETANNSFTAYNITDVYFGSGRAKTSSPTSYTIHGSSPIGTNIAGASLTLAAGAGTGSATSGGGENIKFALPVIGSSGTTIQTLNNYFNLSASGTVDAVNASSSLNFSPTASANLLGSITTQITGYTDASHWVGAMIFKLPNGGGQTEYFRIEGTDGFLAPTGKVSGLFTTGTFKSNLVFDNGTNFDVGNTNTNFPLEVTGKIFASTKLIAGGDIGVHSGGGSQGVVQDYHGLQLAGETSSLAQSYTPATAGIGGDAYHVVVPMLSTTAAGLAVLGITSQTGNYIEATSQANKTTAHGDIWAIKSTGNMLINTTADTTRFKAQINGRVKITQYDAASSNDSLMAFNPTTHGLRMTKLVAGTGIGVSYASGNITLSTANTPIVQSSGSVTAQTAAATLPSYTVGAADGTFIVSANVLVTTSTVHSFSATCTYTDESNTSRVLTLNFSQLTGAFVTAITNGTGASAYEGVPVHIRCKAATTIQFATTGTFTGVTYNFGGVVQQIN